jgi:hypothetical protein
VAFSVSLLVLVPVHALTIGRFDRLAHGLAAGQFVLFAELVQQGELVAPKAHGEFHGPVLRCCGRRFGVHAFEVSNFCHYRGNKKRQLLPMCCQMLPKKRAFWRFVVHLLAGTEEPEKSSDSLYLCASPWFYQGCAIQGSNL